MSIELIARVLIESQSGFGNLGIEYVVINTTDATYIGFAKVGTKVTDPYWIIYRVKQVSDSIYTRIANSDENFNKILTQYNTYNYIEP
jgi:hypothetical protein